MFWEAIHALVPNGLQTLASKSRTYCKQKHVEEQSARALPPLTSLPTAAQCRLEIFQHLLGMASLLPVVQVLTTTQPD